RSRPRPRGRRGRARPTRALSEPGAGRTPHVPPAPGRGLYYAVLTIPMGRRTYARAAHGLGSLRHGTGDDRRRILRRRPPALPRRRDPDVVPARQGFTSNNFWVRVWLSQA